MAHSLRRAATEPDGTFTTTLATTFTMRADRGRTRQRREHAGEVAEYPIEYVIGSGAHALGYLLRAGDHLFQSPVCYYTNRRAYDLAPGYENLPDPDFTRPVTEACLLCHAGQPLLVKGTVNRYQSPPFAQEAISCDRCHGPVERHLEHPSRGNIVNPVKLPQAARDSVCEQCHLAGAARVLNPGKSFADFHPGRPLEEVFTIYVTDRSNNDFKVISHSEQLAQSACVRKSESKLWCGTCHNPHDKPAQPARYYASRCMDCHRGKLPAEHAAKSDCTGCHMPRRPARDGGHAVFTDHRITRVSQSHKENAVEAELVAWRVPDANLEQRNMALALANWGVERRSPAQIVRGYRMLTEVQKLFPDDPEVFNALGTTLLLGKEPGEALRAFERVLQLTPENAVSEQNVGIALNAAGEFRQAAVHLERSLEIDPLLLPAATTLMNIYRRQGDDVKASALADRIRKRMSGP